MLRIADAQPRRYLLLLFLFALHVLPFASRAALIGGDEPHYALMAHSIAFDFDLQIADDYEAVGSGASFAGRKAAGKHLDRHVRSVHGNEVFSHPIGLPLIATPVVLVNVLRGESAAPDIPLALLTLTVTFMALIVGFKLVAELTQSTRDAALLIVCLYFGSPLWFYSRTFFTEPYSWSFTVFAIAAIRSNRMITASLWLALVLAVKETGAILMIAVGVATILHFGMKKSLPLVFGPLLFGIFFATKNYRLVGTPFSTFQRYQVGEPVQGAIGLLIDPFHGLLWFSPILVVALMGWFLRPSLSRRILWPAAAAFVAYYVVTAAWIDWRGGSSYATRLLLPALPAVVLPAIVAFRQTGPFRVFLLPLFMVSFVPNWVAANRPFVAFWGETSAATLVRQNWLLSAAGFVVALSLFAAILVVFPRSQIVLDEPRT